MMDDILDVTLPAKIRVNIGDEHLIYTIKDFKNPLDYVELCKMCVKSRPNIK